MRRPWLLFLHLPRRPTPQQTSPGSHVHSRQLPASDHAVSWPAALASVLSPQSARRDRYASNPVTDGSQGQQGKPLCVLRVVPPTSALSLAKSCSLTHGFHPGPAFQEGPERAGRLLLKLGH